MAKEQKRVSEIVGAAEALEDEIARLETLSKSARKIRLTSGKNIARAAAELNETLALPERLAQRLQDVAKALAHMQERQQAALEPLTAFAVEVQRRTQLLAEQMQSFDALGKAAGEINAALAASQGDRAVIARAQARLLEISNAAREAFEAARAADFPEIAREADVFKQRMAALHERLGSSTQR
jgi:chromosome segregation ATPase